MRFGKSDKIKFVSTIEGLELIDKSLPRPAKHFIPQWFKDIPSQTGDITTVKKCPSFPDYFSQGYILPMWTDVKLKYENNVWNWQTPTDKITWSHHDNNQFLDYVTPSFNGVDAQFVFKTHCPWRIITPPGWSVLQLPLFYHFNQEWSVLPGILDSDIYSQINQQVLYHGDGKEIMIKAGDPFALYIPFKRSNKLKYEVGYENKKDRQIFNKQDFNFETTFLRGGIYKKMQKRRDKKSL